MRDAVPVGVCWVVLQASCSPPSSPQGRDLPTGGQCGPSCQTQAQLHHAQWEDLSFPPPLEMNTHPGCGISLTLAQTHGRCLVDPVSLGSSPLLPAACAEPTRLAALWVLSLSPPGPVPSSLKASPTTTHLCSSHREDLSSQPRLFLPLGSRSTSHELLGLLLQEIPPDLVA